MKDYCFLIPSSAQLYILCCYGNMGHLTSYGPFLRVPPQKYEPKYAYVSGELNPERRERGKQDFCDCILS